MGEEHDTHGTEDQAQPYGGDPVNASEKNAVYKKLNDELKADEFEHYFFLQRSPM